MMRVAPAQHIEMQRDARLGGKGAPELLNELGVEVTNTLWQRHRTSLIDQIRASGDVYHGAGQSLIHGSIGGAEAGDTAPLTQRITQRLAKHDSHVLDGVVIVNRCIAARCDTQRKAPMTGESGEQMVEERDTGGDRS